MRAPIVLLFCSPLTACSTAMESSIITPYVPPSMPTVAAANEGIKKAATEKLTGPIEMSDLRETDHGPGRFFVCIRGVDSIHRRVGTYAVFLDNNDYKGSRMSVIMDDCEKQEYRPFP